VLLFFSILSVAGWAQNASTDSLQKISGKITDSATGAPLTFVTVGVENTTMGTITDDNGAFTLKAAPGTVLIVSYLGYVTKKVTVGSSPLEIKLLRQQNTLEQVVVVGYGTQRKRDVTTAVSSISGQEIAKQPVLIASEAIQGEAAGVQVIDNGTPGTSPTVLVRGVGTVLGGTRVLYVVDGLITNDISNINPADIATFDILKDASATAIYGSRGANGVIIITTKKGSKGKVSVSYDANVGIKDAENLVKMANAAQYANYYAAASGTPLKTSPTSTDWYGEILRNAWQQNHNLSLSGGGDQITYLLSLGYFDEDGIVISNNYKRYTIRSNLEYTPYKNIKIGLNTSYANNNDKAVPLNTAYNDAYRAAPIIPAIVDGKYGNTSSYGNVGNPLLDINSVDNRIIDNRFQATAYLEVRIINGLTFRSSVGGDLHFTNNRSYDYRFNNNDSTFITAGGNQKNPLSLLNVNDSTSFWYVWDNTLTYNKSFGKHSFTLLGGTSAEQFKGTSIVAQRNNIAPDPSLWYISLGDANTSQNNGYVDFWRRASYFGRLNYNYDDKYLFAATLREDGSTRLPVQNRWQLYPSASAGWIISQEDFMMHQHFVDYLKLRAGWGKVGNDQVPSDAYTSSIAYNYGYPYTAGTATNGAKIPQIVDNNLTWETTKEYDFGLEFTTFNKRLSGEVNYYNKEVKNLLVNVLVPGTTGDLDHKIYSNIGTVQNKGWEFTLNWSDHITKDLTYHIGGNLTLNQNKVLSLNGGQAILDGGILSQEYATVTEDGSPIGSFYVLKVLGVFQNQAQIDNYKNKAGQVIQPGANPGDFIYQDTNGDGKIDDNDRVFAGAYQPKAYYGISLGLNYKGFDFSVNLYGNAGNQVYNGKRADRQALTDNIEASMAFNRWTPENGSQTEPAANGGNLPASTYFVESGSFIRINNVTLGYTLPSRLFRKLKISSLRVFATSQNLYTYKKYSGFTAELPGTSPTNGGIELDPYPTARTVAAGVNLRF